MNPLQSRKAKGINRISSFCNSGVYFLCDDSSILYIGKSTNVYARVHAHLKSSKKFKHVFWVHFDENEIHDMESALIKAIKPKYNWAYIKNQYMGQKKPYLYHNSITDDLYIKCLDKFESRTNLKIDELCACVNN